MVHDVVQRGGVRVGQHCGIRAVCQRPLHKAMAARLCCLVQGGPFARVLRVDVGLQGEKKLPNLDIAVVGRDVHARALRLRLPRVYIHAIPHEPLNAGRLLPCADVHKPQLNHAALHCLLLASLLGLLAAADRKRLELVRLQKLWVQVLRHQPRDRLVCRVKTCLVHHFMLDLCLQLHPHAFINVDHPGTVRVDERFADLLRCGFQHILIPKRFVLLHGKPELEVFAAVVHSAEGGEGSKGGFRVEDVV
mmetsp:Transcript_40564/g.102119  ORF Transcript_40564/g.102119 Transcript_40564/m.102119 type:complete len:249 (-) Transcript_40564:167-913(-)